MHAVCYWHISIPKGFPQFQVINILPLSIKMPLSCLRWGARWNSTSTKLELPCNPPEAETIAITCPSFSNGIPSRPRNRNNTQTGRRDATISGLGRISSRNNYQQNQFDHPRAHSYLVVRTVFSFSTGESLGLTGHGNIISITVFVPFLSALGSGLVVPCYQHHRIGWPRSVRSLVNRRLVRLGKLLA